MIGKKKSVCLCLMFVCGPDVSVVISQKDFINFMDVLHNFIVSNEPCLTLSFVL